MYNGIGLQTARGSGTNGYIQSNKFFVRHKVSKVLTDPSSFKSFESGEGTAGLSRKPNREILEHDRKRQIELKLLVLEEKLTDQGYSDSEVAEKLQEARISLEAQVDDEDGGAGAVFGSEKRVSDTQTHQIAARKEKQMETLRAALGIGAETENQKQQPDVPASDSEDIGDDDEPLKSDKKDALAGRKHGKDAVKKKDETKKASKHKKDEAGTYELDEPKRHKKKENRRGRHEESSESDSEGKTVKESKKKHRSAHISESDDDSDSDVDVRKRRQKSSAKKSRSRRHDSDYSDSGSDSDSSSDSGRDKKYGKLHKRHDSDDDYSSDEDSKVKSQKVKKISKRVRHDSEDESGSDIERNDRRNHSEKKRDNQRAKDDNVRDDHRLGKERRDEDSGRYGLKSDSQAEKALRVKNELDKSRRRYDIGEDEPRTYREKEDRNIQSEKKRNDQQTAFRLEKDDVRDDHRISKESRDKVGGRYELKSDSGSDKVFREKNKIEKTGSRHDRNEDEPSYREREDRRNYPEKKRKDLQTALRSEKDDVVRNDHRVSKERSHKIGGRDDLKSESEFDQALEGKNKIDKTRRRHDSDEDVPSSGREKEHRNYSEKKWKEDDIVHDQALEGKNKIDKTRRRHDSAEDVPSSGREKEHRNYSEKKRKEDAIVHVDHRVSKGRKDEVRGRYNMDSDSESDKAPKRKSKVEKTRRRRDSDEDESDHGKKKANHRSRKHDSDEDDSDDSRDSSSDSDASDHRYKRGNHDIKSVEKNSSRRLDTLNDRERKTGEGHDEKMKDKKAAQKVDDGGLDTLKTLEKLYQSRDEKKSGYGGQEPNKIKRKMGDDEDWDEQPERKTRRRDLGKDAEPEGKAPVRNKEIQRGDDHSDRRGKIASKVEVHNERSDRDHDVDSRGRREADTDKELQGRKHKRDEEEDVHREHQPERHRREQEEGHASRYGRDRDVDSSKRARYDDSRTSGRRYDDDRRDDSRSRR